jgi:DNA-binding winged helix-turn-helix (wHTH) protein/Tol biopolymer transport system component
MNGKRFYEFGPYRIDPNRNLLLRGGEPIPLTSKAFEVLLVLVEQGDQTISKDQLMRKLWPDTFVEEANLTKHISMVRKALGETAQDHRYILTLPGRGYRFAEKVLTISDEEADLASIFEGESLVVESHSRMTVVSDEESFPEVDQAATVTEAPRKRGTRWKFAVGGAMLGLVVFAVAFRPTVPPPKVVRIRQITHLGSLVHNTKLLTDGARIYFRAWKGNDRVLLYVSPEGGEVFPAEMPFPQTDLNDISPGGSEFLATNLGDQSSSSSETASVWSFPAPSGSPRPLGNLRANEARWSPDEHAIAYSVGSDLYLADSDGSKARKWATLPGDLLGLVWSPDGKRLRFSVADPSTKSAALWQVDFPTNTVRRSLPDWINSWRLVPGGWTPDERYFFFVASGKGTGNIWAIREKDELLRRVNPQPMQITAGPLTFYPPLPGKDGKSVFAVGEQSRGQLVRYDAAAQQFVPYAKGISADHIAFSRDGQWMAYIDFLERVLVRSRVDGSERRQLTFPPMRAYMPQWSPDGTQIAFQASAQMGANDKIYLVSSSGGAPVLASPESRDRQIDPCWASDGDSIFISSSDETGSNPSLQRLELKTRHSSLLPGSAGLYGGQVSPDGQYVVALEDTTHKLMLYDMVTHNTRILGGVADYPRWSADGQYVYFSTPYFFNPRGNTSGVYRWKFSTNTTEAVITYPDFLLAGVYGVSYGLTPAGEILMLRDLSTRDLYALDLELP